MKKILITIALLTNVILSYSQNWEWVKLIQPNDNKSYMTGMADLYGNVYGAGFFNQSINLGNSQSISGNWDGFLSKFDTSGACQWAQHIYVTTQGCGCTTEGNRSSAQVAGFDSQGNVIVTGWFCGCGAAFGSGITSNYPGYALFLAKYSPSGQCLWVQTKASSMNTSTGQTDDFFNALTIDKQDNIYISMFNFANSVTFCGLNFANQGEYFFKVNTNGGGIWNKQIATTTSGYSIMQMEYFNKRIFATSQYTGVCSFGTTTLTAQGSLDVAATKMDTAGNVLAAADIGSSSGQTSALSLAISNNRVVLLSQSGSSSIIVGTYTLNTGSGMDNTFLVAYDTTNLSVQTARNTANNSNGSGTGLYNDNKGNMYLLAYNNTTTGFGNISNVPIGKHIIKMDATLYNYWHLENTNTCVAPDTLGNLYTIDNFSGSDTYGSFTETATNGITLGKITNAYTTGIQNRTAQTNNMQVYPNPSSSLFNLMLSTTILNNNSVTVSLYDVTGRLLNNIPYTQPDESTLQINLTNYAEGNYLIKVQVDGVLYSAKLER